MFIAGESGGWEAMLSGLRLTATLSGAQPVEEQICPLHRANLFSSAVLLEECSFPETSLPFQNTPFTSSCRQIPTSWAPAMSQMGSAYLWDQGWSTAQGEGCFLHCWEAAGLADRRPRGAASNSLSGCGVSWTCAGCARDLHYGLTCKYWFLPVPELPYQMMPNRAEMSGSFAM